MPAPEMLPIPPQDSLLRQLAHIEIRRAETEAESSDFWHRLIPRVELSATIGERDLLFPDPSGGYILPRDSYRISLSFAPMDLFDGSKHALALLRLEEARTRYALLLRNQAQVHLALERKRIGIAQDLALAREQADLTKLLLEYYELLFKQGKAEFHTVTRSRLEAVRMRGNLLDLERRSRELGFLSH
jgi:hypothetical protein